ncbi:MAG: zinc ribbon domain-containing protein [Clostridia bacterium]|nr:zinc ribbon domain-containing protein [Clostridia bacterium]
MKKEKKIALYTGKGPDGSEYFYFCPKCKTKNDLNQPYCTYCGKKRPRDAYENAHVERGVLQQQQVAPVYGMDIDRTVRNAYPTPVNPAFAVPMPTNGNYDAENYMRNTALGLPTYYQTDEYGRVYKAKVSYGAMPCSAPVPVATPAKTVQNPTINVNLK